MFVKKNIYFFTHKITAGKIEKILEQNKVFFKKMQKYLHIVQVS